MKCSNCGQYVADNELFCLSCGMKISQETTIDKHIYISIGQPLGYSGYNSEIVYLVDLGFARTVISQNDLIVWADPNHMDAEFETITRLIQKKCLIDISDLNHLEEFKTLIPVRQGFGSAHNDKHAIMLAKMPTYVTENQMYIWRLSDGKNRVQDIVQMLSRIDKEELFNAFKELQAYDLIYFKGA